MKEARLLDIAGTRSLGFLPFSPFQVGQPQKPDAEGVGCGFPLVWLIKHFKEEATSTQLDACFASVPAQDSGERPGHGALQRQHPIRRGRMAGSGAGPAAGQERPWAQRVSHGFLSCFFLREPDGHFGGVVASL